MEHRGKVNPTLRYEFEELPIEVKNSILEAGEDIKSVEDLREAAERAMHDALY